MSVTNDHLFYFLLKIITSVRIFIPLRCCYSYYYMVVLTITITGAHTVNDANSPLPQIVILRRFYGNIVWL